MALAALATFSCSQQNNEELDTTLVPGLELTIIGAKASRATANTDGEKLPGAGDENRVVNFGAFVRELVKGPGDAATAADGKVYVFRELADYNPGAGKTKLEFGKVAVGSDIYVMVNYKQDPALVPTTGWGESVVLGSTYTREQIEGLFQKIQKGDLNSFSEALQTDPLAPVFVTPASATNSMLMTGSTKVPTAPLDPADNTRVKVEVAVERQFVKINAGMPIVGDVFNDNNVDVVIDKNNLHPQDDETIYFLRRTAQTLYYFDYAKSLMALPFIKDVVPGDIAALGSNTDLNEPTATEYRYAYERGADANKANFYATRNQATVNLGATSVIYRIGYKCDIEIPAKTFNEHQLLPVPANTLFYRYYKTYVTEEYTAGAPTKWGTGASLFYQFDNSLIGWGSDTEDEAIDSKETVDINVNVKMKDWTVKVISVGME